MPPAKERKQCGGKIREVVNLSLHVSLSYIYFYFILFFLSFSFLLLFFFIFFSFRPLYILSGEFLPSKLIIHNGLPRRGAQTPHTSDPTDQGGSIIQSLTLSESGVRDILGSPQA